MTNDCARVNTASCSSFFPARTAACASTSGETWVTSEGAIVGLVGAEDASIEGEEVGSADVDADVGEEDGIGEDAEEAAVIDAATGNGAEPGGGVRTGR